MMVQARLPWRCLLGFVWSWLWMHHQAPLCVTWTSMLPATKLSSVHIVLLQLREFSFSQWILNLKSVGSPPVCDRHPEVAAGQNGANNFSPIVGLCIFLEALTPQIVYTILRSQICFWKSEIWLVVSSSCHTYADSSLGWRVQCRKNLSPWKHGEPQKNCNFLFQQCKMRWRQRLRKVFYLEKCRANFLQWWSAPLSFPSLLWISKLPGQHSTVTAPACGPDVFP